MLDAADPPLPIVDTVNISREVRGLAILLLFASYENLLTSLCRGLLETAAKLRVGNHRLRVGFRQFAVYNHFESISDSSESKIWRETGRELLENAFATNRCTINTNRFPSDGSFMKRSQVKLFFSLFELGDPGLILKEIWSRLDTVVTERNKIAHGQLTPEEVGRGYTRRDLRDLVDKWELRWIDAINYVEVKASTRDFYRY